MGNAKKKTQSKSYWETLPGIITALGALLTAIGGCLTAVVTWPRPNIIFPATLTPVPQEAASELKENPILDGPTASSFQQQPTDEPSLTPTPTLPKYFLEIEQRLYVGDQMLSANQQFSLRLQTDGNLVLYEEGGRVIWATNTSGKQAGYLVLQIDGNLVLYAENGAALWASESAGPAGDNYYFQLNDDGNLVIYNDRIPVWSSNTSR